MNYILIGTGFEEVEALYTVDILRRAGIEIQLAGIGALEITGGHGIRVVCDVLVDEVTDPELLILPGGLGGVAAIEGSEKAMALVEAQKDKLLAAICAAPSILGKRGWADGKNVTCYPGYETQMGAAIPHPESAVVVDGELITGRAAGAAYAFGLAIVEKLLGAQARKKVADAMVIV